MQEHQVRDVLDDRLRILQSSQALTDHLGADHFVVMKTHPTVRFMTPGCRLADVVQDRRPPQDQIGIAVLEVHRLGEHGEGVGVDILVLMVFVDGQLHPGYLGDDQLGQAGLTQRLDSLDRMFAEDQLVEFGRNPLHGDPFDLACHLHRGREHPW